MDVEQSKINTIHMNSELEKILAFPSKSRTYSSNCIRMLNMRHGGGALCVGRVLVAEAWVGSVGC